MKRQVLLAVLAFGAVSAWAQTQIKSPDGRLVVEITANDGVPAYQVTYDDDVFMRKSSLGLQLEKADLTKNMKLSKASDVKRVTDSYSVRSLKKCPVTFEANEMTVTFADEKGRDALDVEWHVDNNNVAFRYVVRRIDNTYSRIVERENTAFYVAEGSLSYNCPPMGPQSGFARTAPSYESRYEHGVPCKEDAGKEIVFPALFKVADKGWMMVSETGLTGEYCACHLKNSGDGNYNILFPSEKEFGGIGTAKPGLSLPATLPWRTITVGRTLAPIAETTITWDVVKEQYAASQEYKYGRATWSWIIRMDASCNFDEQKEYVDFAAAMGYEYVLVDALWDTNIGYDGIERLAKYAATKGVGLFLWYNSNGYWNDAPQGPRDKLHRAPVRQREMRWLQKTGIKGLKVDFIGSDKQQTIQLYEDILTDANNYGLMMIYHGCTLPRGWERMYPNFVSAEAVRASENLSFDQWENDHEAESATMHPILRNAVGNMDFGGSALNKHYSKDNRHGRTRRTSDVFQLACAVLFQTPVQNFALAPNNMTDAPAWAIDFMKTVPTVWRDVKFLEGEPGKYLVFARQSAAGKWYVAAINAQKEPLKLKLKLPMFAAGSAVQLYSDRVTATDDKGWNTFEGSVADTKTDKKQTLQLTIPKDGAAVVVEK